MRLARRVVGIIVGYAIFAVSAVLWFRLSGHDPHAAQPAGFIVSSIMYGMVFAAIGGYVSAAIGGGSARAQGAVLALLIALGATVSLLAVTERGSAWSMLGALFLMAPSAAVGGSLREVRGKPAAKRSASS